MRTTTALLLLPLLTVTVPVYGGDEAGPANPFVPLKGTPIDPQAQVIIDTPESIAANEVRAAGTPEVHWGTVPNVITGQRIPLPRAADGSCREDTEVTIDATNAKPSEYDADGRHWTQHQIKTRVMHGVDYDNCELVLDAVEGADRVKRRIIKRKAPPEFDKMLLQSPPVEPQSSVFHRTEQMARPFRSSSTRPETA